MATLEWLYLLISYLLYAVGFLLALLIGTYFAFLQPYHVDDSVPGPKRVPFLGVTFGSESSDSEIFHRGDGESFTWDTWPTLSLLLARQYGFRTWGGPTLNIGFGGAFFVIVDPVSLQHMLRDNFENYEKGKITRKTLQELLGKGIFTADGSTWKKHRKLIVSNILTKDRVKYGATLMLRKLQQVESLLLSVADGNTTVDFQDVCYRMVLDVFVNMAFGVELNSLTQPSDKHRSFVTAFNELQYLCHQRLNDLFWEMKQVLCLTEREKRIRQQAKILREFADSIIQASRKHTTNNEESPDIVSQVLRQAKEDNEPPPTDQELRDIVMNFVLAGRDSTAVGLSWTMFELTRHPIVADKIREEVQNVCKGNVTYQAVEKLYYTHAVVMEALRLHTPVPDDFKFAKNDDVLPDGTRIPAGSCVMYSPYTINHSEKNWGENAEKFVPERFLGTLEPSPFRYPSFNAGPRSCPGKPLALVEIKMALAFLLPRFEFIDKAGHTGDYTWTLIMSMKDGFPVEVKRII